MLCDPDLPSLQQYSVQVLLDPDTANPMVSVSEDGKQVKWERIRRLVPRKPQRFDCVLNVLAKEGFNTNSFDYEVQVKGKTEWNLGIASESINRKGDIRLSPQNGYWTIWLRKGHEYTANAEPAVVLNLKKQPQNIGANVDGNNSAPLIITPVIRKQRYDRWSDDEYDDDV
ncbi:Zinc-binding protein A33 [Merluccius polli]|uniref:Zinc-binding protein A33 n=1 Tax=Merluccius polli TaxID=89951 RepID=A0AA47MGB2_MERPO|nr:Zinc-binding protein A33 [Merluccius polli]